MVFSGALTLTDLNDFITPSQACIKPVEQVKLPQNEKLPGAAVTRIQVDSSGSYYEVSAGTSSQHSKKLETAQISLNDCLACSGCITSAESVLITMQSHEEVFNFLSNNPNPSAPDHRIPVLSISPQSLASLSASLSSSSQTSVTLLQVLRRVQAFCLNELGFAHVYDTTFARHLTLLEHAQEFHQRRREGTREGADAKLPMFTSACPGWVCYAEKTHAEMLPFISRTKSPQQIMGTLVKNWLGKKWRKTPNEIYHVTVMPCYDKKLEASRTDFYNDLYSTRDVDCVITTGELELMMLERKWDLSAAVPGEGQYQVAALPELLSHIGSSSGSYLSSLASSFLTTDDTQLAKRTVRNADYEEYVITNIATGEVVFKGAKCYGFRNLQNVVRKVGKAAGVQVGKGAAGRLTALRAGRAGKFAEKEKDLGYDCVEVMACPSGCVNGGGQLKHRTKLGPVEDVEGTDDAAPPGEPDMLGARWGDKEWTKRVEEAYWRDLPTLPRSSTIEVPMPNTRHASLKAADELAWQVLKEVCEPLHSDGTWGTVMDIAAEEKRRRFFRTEYRAVESDVVGLSVKW